MGGDKDNIVPIMTNSESIPQFGNNAYAKPATALNILRETVMGRELFDIAFKEYATRWAFKHPSPADFFRTMEDASGIDLDWFWRGWFYTKDNVDLSMSSVNYFKADSQSPDERSAELKAARGLPDIAKERNKSEILQTQEEIDNSLIDFYTTYDPLDVDDIDREAYDMYMQSISPEERDLINSNQNYYEITIENNGGLVMPIIIQMEYADGTSEIKRFPAEIWKMNTSKITKIIPTDKEVVQFTLDPYQETADTDISNNHFPPKPEAPSRFEVFKRKQMSRGQSNSENPMQRAKRAEAKKKIKP
jgi:aminopeptidase N